jgi:dynein heavy chain
LKVINEVSCWNKIQSLGFVSMPHSIVRLLQDNETLRKLRENVMTVVREYNNIQDLIADNERDLFQEHLAKLDNAIQPGILRYDWKSNVDLFVEFCRKECFNVFNKIKVFQQRKGEINEVIEGISNTYLTSISKKLYDLNTFINTQENELRKHQQNFQKALTFMQEKIVDTYTE